MKIKGCLIASIFLFLFIAFIVCWDVFVSSGVEPNYQLITKKLDRAQKEIVARTALNLLSGEKIEELSSYMTETGDGDYLLFVSFALDGGKARVGFGRGKNLFTALQSACKDLARLFSNEMPWKLGILKVDLVRGLSDKIELDKNSQLKLTYGIDGLLFERKSTVFVMPEEIWGWNVLEKNGLVRLKILERLLSRTSRGSSVAAELQQDKKVKVRTFRAESFGLIHGEFYDFWRGKAVPLGEITGDSLESSIDSAVDCLICNQEKSGRFLYTFYPESLSTGESYNIVRHAGVLWSLCERYNKKPTEPLLKTIVKAKDFLLSNVETFEDAQGRKLSALVFKDEVKLGAVALGLVALVEYSEVTGDRSLEPVLLKLAEFILYCQKPSGEFHHKYHIKRKKFLDFESDFYPGESILALIELYNHTNDAKWLDAAKLAARYLIEVRDANKSEYALQPDQWLMIALERLYKIEPDPLWREHLFKIGRSMLLKQHKTHRFMDYIGGFYEPPVSAVTATRAEGLVAAYRVAVSEDPAFAQEIERSLLLVADFLRFRQYTPELAMYVRRPQIAMGAFSESALSSSFRMDYIQHCISALMGISEIVGGR